MVVIGILFSAPEERRCERKLQDTWVSTKGSWITIYKRDGKFYGKPLKKPETTTLRKDVNNPDSALQGRFLVDVEILKDFTFDNGAFTGGTIYDPNNGKTYRCKMWFEPTDPNTLYIRGYIGISLFGRTATWTRKTPVPLGHFRKD